jgi:hypothetical protein
MTYSLSSMLISSGQNLPVAINEPQAGSALAANASPRPRDAPAISAVDVAGMIILLDYRHVQSARGVLWLFIPSYLRDCSNQSLGHAKIAI